MVKGYPEENSVSQITVYQSFTPCVWSNSVAVFHWFYVGLDLRKGLTSVCCESPCTMFALSWQGFGSKNPYGKSAALHPGIGKTHRGCVSLFIQIEALFEIVIVSTGILVYYQFIFLYRFNCEMLMLEY